MDCDGEVKISLKRYNDLLEEIESLKKEMFENNKLFFDNKHCVMVKYGNMYRTDEYHYYYTDEMSVKEIQKIQAKFNEIQDKESINNYHIIGFKLRKKQRRK